MSLTFDPVRHRYELDGHWLPGVTTVIGVLSKPQLIQWAANMAVDWIIANGYPRRLSETDYELVIHPDLLEQARTAHIRKRDKAADKGTGAHELVETYVKRCIEVGDLIAPHCEFTHELGESVEAFAKWADKNDVKFLDCEVMVYSELHRYAGRFDLLFEQGGKRYLGDIKTGKGVYADFFIQMGGYEVAYQEMTGQSVDGRVILHLNSKSCTPHISTDANRDTSAFLNCLALYKALKLFPELTAKPL